MPRAVDLETRAVASLARGEKSRQQLVQYLLKHAPPEDVERVVADLVQRGLQSDARAAEVAARDALRKGFTSSRAVEELLADGLERAIALRAVEEAYASVNEKDALAREVARRLPADADARTRRKVARALVTRGFDEDRVMQACGLEGDA